MPNNPITSSRGRACRRWRVPYWRNWLRPEFRCLVPATSFCEWTDSRPKVPHWFALNDKRPLFAFCWPVETVDGERKGAAAEHRLYVFLTTESNALVRPIHAKAMPVILCDPEAWDIWLTGSVEEALEFQRPLSAERMEIVETNIRADAVGQGA
jgi:putative SOS response-associated peptidase YedK